MIIVLKPLDEQGYPGYGIATNGTVWTLWNRHGQITKRWKKKSRFPRRGILYVRLRVEGGLQDVRVGELLLQAAFRKFPDFAEGYAIRYGKGGKSDCSLTNLSYGSLSSKYFDGSRFANTIPPGFSKIKVSVERGRKRP